MIKGKISVIFFIMCGALTVWGDDAIIETTELPDRSEIPTLCNGHIGFVVFGDAILLNGLYNGAKGESHRARIPNYSNIETSIACTGSNCNYSLNMRQGYFEAIMTAPGGQQVVEHIYAHRFYNRAIINKFHLRRESATGVVSVSLTVNPGEVPSVDLNEIGTPSIESIGGRDVTIRFYQTNVVEITRYQFVPSKVYVAYTNPPATLNLAAGEILAEYMHVTVVGRTEEEVRKEMLDVINSEATIRVDHTTVWEDAWRKFEIAVEGNENLNQIIHASVFYLVSNLPSEVTNQPKDQFYGLSPSGIGKGGILYAEYQGHSFWDTEMWMHPPILLLNPKWSEDILSYRFNSRQAAADNAKDTGYNGYRYPWESAFTGGEVTPDCCPEVVEYQHHVIADIAFAFRSHLAATHDVEWFKSVGCDIAWNTARFWESRVKLNATTKFYDIRNVMGPDEDHHDIDNNVYTNVNAAINLYFGDFAACACNDVLRVSDADYEDFVKIAKSLTLLYDAERDFHPQYEGYNGEDIKQADAVLLGFPLQFPMNAATKRNNLLIYDNVTRVNGPAMTWAMHTVGFLDLQDQVEAAKVFERSYETYTREPFKVWSEVIPGNPGAGNFITGAGGFLQSIINGYGGIRLHFDSLTITNFFVPPQTTSLVFSGITYLNNRFSLRITGDQATVTILEIDATRRFKATLKPIGQVTNPVNVGFEFTFSRDQELVFESVTNPFGDCKMKETVVGKELTPTVEPVVKVNDWVVGATSLPAASEVPTVSNGHIGMVISGDAILMNGLYNGERGESHRARIPNYSNVAISETCFMKSCEYLLNMRNGYFESKITTGNKYQIEQQIYAHRFYNRVIINRIVLERLNGTMDLEVALSVNQGDEPGVDLTQVGDTKTELIAQRSFSVKCFETNIVENSTYQLEKSKVCVAYTIPMTLTLARTERILEYIHVTVVGRTENEIRKEILDMFANDADHDVILSSHIAAWDQHWEKFGISVTGNMKLNQVIHGSIFYLISNLPSETTNQPKEQFYGLSPSGIGKGGILFAEYQGHSFWDTEMWMHPPILLLNPKWSEDILSYRYMTRNAAADNAKDTGYNGYRYPWESAFTGGEVTPDCCPDVVEYQHHVIADIAFAFRSHLAATHDVEWFKSVGCDIAWNTAKFWESRVKFNATTLNYDIRNVMGPDEDHPAIDNNVYTNVNAALNLFFGEFAACACKDVLNVSDDDFENFVKIARNLTILYDAENDFHPQFEGFNETIIIKQADVVLLGFPLQFPMKANTKRNNLIKYDKITRDDGPAMTWAMHTVGFLDLNDEVEAAKVFERSFSLYTREPFKVWTEAMPGVEGAGNFITGAGGFLQSIINGYGGIRLHFDSLTITNFYVPQYSSSLNFNGITYLNNRFSLSITGDEATVTFKELDSNHPIKFTMKPSNAVHTPSVGYTIKFKRDEELVMQSSTKPFGTCEMKEIAVEQDAAGAVVTASIVLMSVLALLAMTF